MSLQVLSIRKTWLNLSYILTDTSPIWCLLLVPRTRYTYDSLNQLTRVEYPGYTEELYYDRAGNRRRRVSAGVEESYEYDPANHLTEYTKGGVKTTFTYDNAGNLTADDKARYTYDLFNRTEKVETFDGHVQINRYDAEGLRHEMEEDGKLVQFIFRGQEVVMEKNGDNKIRHIRGYELIASDAESARMYYHYASDEMGSITHVAEGKDVLNRYEYDAWGNLTLCEETVENRFKFNGQQYDPISQQYYLRARYYNPVIARFTQEDTYRGDGLNLYAYCRNNPVYYADPSGHSCDKDANGKHSNDGQERGVPLLPAPEPILALPGPVMEPPIINPMQEMQRAQQLRELSAPEPILTLPGPVIDNYANRVDGPNVNTPDNSNRVENNSGRKSSLTTEERKTYDAARASGLTASQAYALATGNNPLKLPPGGGKYCDVKGHHVLQQAAFRGSAGYNSRVAFAISDDYMDSMGIPHRGPDSVTSAQTSLQKELRLSGASNTMDSQAYIAYNAIINGAISNANMQNVRSYASQVVIYAVTDMYAQGVMGPSRIPGEKK